MQKEDGELDPGRQDDVSKARQINLHPFVMEEKGPTARSTRHVWRARDQVAFLSFVRVPVRRFALAHASSINTASSCEVFFHGQELSVRGKSVCRVMAECEHRDPYESSDQAF